MKKNLKLLFVMVTVFVCCFTTNVFAEEIKVKKITYDGDMIDKNVIVETKGLSEFIPNEKIVPIGTSVPSATWNLGTNGQYNMSGESTNTILYSNYLFKGTTTMNIWVTYAKWYNVNIKLMKKRTILSDVEVASFTHTTEMEYPNKASQFIVTGLDASSKYYLKINAPVYFEGYVTK